ncbi:hypothetical protein CVT24_000929 [Panaeolus cyanescens]|uniref:Xylanolytic transcriptional activator regulatory domain-containing protein n=1 Tax=Panaeolus cyanescens TaxID=181874 RepID=A0A409YTH5_9AGAR|nr:hypothetical protein CVT24_000929 [Panaeolus cyanescens]
MGALGVLAQGRGGRLVLANTEELHEQIDSLSTRNRELEKALRALQANMSSDPHPLLQSDTIRLTLQPDSSPSQSASSSSKSPTASSGPAPADPMDIEEEEEEHTRVDAYGTVFLQAGGESYHFGRTAQPEYLIQSPDRSTQPSSRLHRRIAQLGSQSSQLPVELVLEILDYLPPYSLASHLCEVYLDHGHLWSSSEFSAYDSLSLLLIIFAIATLLDRDNRSSLPAYDFYYLSRAAHQFANPSYTTTLESIQTSVHMAHFLGFYEDTNDHIHSRWRHVGDAVRSVFSAGLYLDASKWKLPSLEAQRRNEAFWAVFVVDTWTSFVLGRPSGICKQSYDSHLQYAISELGTLNGNCHNDYTTWRIHFSILLNDIMQTAMAPKQPTYTAILDFDRQIRDFHVPVAWRAPEADDSSHTSTDILFYRFLIVLNKELVLLTLHRAYFVQALQESGVDLARHRYLPSVVAVYRSSWRLLRSLACTWGSAPRFLRYLRIAWSSAVSASVSLALLVTRSPNSYLANTAVEELENVASLFDKASSTSQAAAGFQPFIQRVNRKARDALSASRGRIHGSGHSLTRAENYESTFSTVDLENLHGKTRLCGESTPSLHSTSVEMGPPSRATSVTISENAESSSHPSIYQNWRTDTLHPVLLRDLREFGIHSSVPPSSSFSFYDQPSDLNRTRTPPGSLVSSTHSSNAADGERRPSPTHLHPSSAAAGGSSSQGHPQPGPSQSRQHVKERDTYEPPREPASERHVSSSTPPHSSPSPDDPPTSGSRSYYSQHQSYSSQQQQQSSTTYPSQFSSSSSSSHVPSIPAGSNSAMFSYFHPASFHYEPYVDYRRTGYGGSGSLNASGLMPSAPSPLGGFAGGGYAAAGFPTPSLVLDSSWSSFVEQLGF